MHYIKYAKNGFVYKFMQIQFNIILYVAWSTFNWHDHDIIRVASDPVL